MKTLSNVLNTIEGTEPQRTEFTFDALPDAKSAKTGVSVEYAYDPNKSWYVFRASHGREDKAFDIIVEDGTYCYIPKRYAKKIVQGKLRKKAETLIPNLLFVYTTQADADRYIKETPALDFLSYYYNHFRLIAGKNPPLLIPQEEMFKLIQTTRSMNEHLLLVKHGECKFRNGDTVKVKEGLFTGVEGRVARLSGQQRVIVSISNIGMIATAYIPSAFLQVIGNNDTSK